MTKQFGQSVTLVRGSDRITVKGALRAVDYSKFEDLSLVTGADYDCTVSGTSVSQWEPLRAASLRVEFGGRSYEVVNLRKGIVADKSATYTLTLRA